MAGLLKCNVLSVAGAVAHPEPQFPAPTPSSIVLTNHKFASTSLNPVAVIDHAPTPLLYPFASVP